MRYPFVLFDVGDTLIAPRRSYGAVYHRVLGDLGVDLPLERLERCLPETAEAMARSIPTGADRFSHFPGGETEYWERFAGRVYKEVTGKQTGPAFGREMLDRLGDAFLDPEVWRIYDDVPPALRELRGAGCRLAVVSNWDSRLPRLLDVLGLAEHFETIGVSHLEGVEKPDPAFFRRVLARMDARPDQALHVGNLPDVDVEGARAAGIDGLLIDRRGELPASVPDLRGLPRIVLGQ